MRVIYIFFLCTYFTANAQIIDIPDANFKNRLVNTFCVDLDGSGNADAKADFNGNGEIEVSEALQIEGLVLWNSNIDSLEGIEYFTNLLSLSCQGNNLTEIDVSPLTSLESLLIMDNDLINLVISENLNLKVLGAGRNNISQIDVSQNLDLERLSIDNSEISSIDVTNNVNLTSLDLQYNNLNELDVIQNNNLQFLNINDNNLSSIDVTQCLNLVRLQIDENNIDQLNVTNNPNLVTLKCSQNNLTNLDVSQNNEIKVECDNNQISDIFFNSNLKELKCNNNLITQLDLSGLNNLEILSCRNNLLNTLILGDMQSIEEINCGANQIPTLLLGNMPNLEVLTCDSNLIEVLSIDQNNIISSLDCDNNLLNTLSLNNSTLTRLYCSNNLLTELNFDNAPSLEWIECKENTLTTLDTNNLFSLFSLNCRDNLITTLFIKNDSNQTTYGSFLPYNLTIYNNPIEYICADNIEIYTLVNNILPYSSNFTGDSHYLDCVVNGYCTFDNSGVLYNIDGTVKFDENNDGCISSNINYPYMKFGIGDVLDNLAFISDENGNYTYPFSEGEYTITPILENPLYFNVSPTSFIVNFPNDTSPLTQDFCLTTNGVFNDLEVFIIPIEVAIPGFNSLYNIVYKNKGSTSLSGTVSLNFDDDVMNFQSSFPNQSSQMDGLLTWNFTNLSPFESREIEVTMELNTPTDPDFPLNSDDILFYSANIDTAAIDETPNDNIFELQQIVVNSFDPNDKTCLEGTVITSQMVGEYVHYMIRFENNGTANAINIVIKDILDFKFDWTTLIPLSSSHNYRVKQSGPSVEFIFEGINIPFDDANNDGYVVFKIKTKSTLLVDDTFSNDAEIYFDFNAPIITNNYVTQIVEEGLSTQNYNILNTRVYPNPVNDILTIESNLTIQSMSVFDIRGRKVLELFENGSNQINMSALKTGIYFVKVYFNTKAETLKVIKNH